MAGARANKAPALLYEEQDIVIRTLRDNYSADVAEVVMNSEAAFRKAEAFFDVYYPKQKGKLKLYRQKRPLFARFNLEEQVERVTARKVPLPSGGHIVIDHTEAIWTIDVNSGRSSKDRDIEDTAYRTNKEAAAEVTRQTAAARHRRPHRRRLHRHGEQVPQQGSRTDPQGGAEEGQGEERRHLPGQVRAGGHQPPADGDLLLRRPPEGVRGVRGLGVVSTRDAAAVRLFRRLHDELSKDAKEGTKDVTVRVAPGLLETLINQKRDEISRIERICGGKVTILADPALPPSSFAIGGNGGKA